jgi:sugar phosphate isomerase/epimerase
MNGTLFANILHSIIGTFHFLFRHKSMMIKIRIYILFAVMTAGMMAPVITAAQKRYQIAVCDWMVLKRQKLGEFALAKQLGCDGVELDMGGLGRRDSFDSKLRDEKQQKIFISTSDSLGIRVPVVAMSGFYAQDLAMKDSYKWLVEDCMNTMNLFGAKIAFLPLGGCGNNWPDSLPLRKEIVSRLHIIGEMAAAQGKIIGIDTPLDADGNITLLNEIDSKCIKIFYKFQTIIENKSNLYKDLKRLGKERICAIHASNTDGLLLKYDSAINMKKVKKTLDKMGWTGWLIVERSRDTRQVHNVKYNYGENVRYLQEIFQ